MLSGFDALRVGSRKTMMSESRLEQIAEILSRHGVQFIVVGGQAEYLFGSPRLTFDVDLCYRRTPENLERLATALKEMNPTLRNAPPDLPFSIDAQTLLLGENFTFSTDFGPLDLLGYLEPVGGYDELVESKETYQIEGQMISTISLDDLIRIKQHIRRQKDEESLAQLLAIKQSRERGEA